MIYIPPTDVRDYAKAKGWALLKEAAKDRLYVMTHPAFEHHQLVFPMDATAPDYLQAVTLATEKLVAIEGRSPQSVLKSLLEVRDDAIGFRVESPRPTEQSVPLAFAASMLEGVKQLLLSSTDLQSHALKKPGPRRAADRLAQRFERHTPPLYGSRSAHATPHPNLNSTRKSTPNLAHPKSARSTRQ